jgi:hypothetical protein
MALQQQGFHDPAVVVPLAEMLEEKGRIRDACDLWRHLAEGPDADNLGRYSFESARLLDRLGQAETARRYAARARELGGGDVAKKLDELDL